MTPHKVTVSLVIPVYNAEPNLEPLLDEISSMRETLGPQTELILVDDGSRDASWAALKRLPARYHWVRAVRLMRNYGQHNALLCGIRLARNEVIVTLDDDCQHPVAEIPALLAKLEEGFDVVYAPPVEQEHGLWRNFASWLTKIVLQEVMGVAAARHVSAFRAFRTHLRQSFAGFSGPSVSLDVLLSWGTSDFAAVPVRHRPRTRGFSNYTVGKLVWHSLDMITGFSAMPLRLASWSGFIFAFFGMVVLASVLGRYLLEGGSVAGFPFLASIIAIFSGAQLFALGIIGEYLARMHFRLMDRPPYALREVVESSPVEGTVS